MSMKSWKDKYYTMESADVVQLSCDPIVLLKRSLAKWVGLRECNLLKHGLTRNGTAILAPEYRRFDIPVAFRIDHILHINSSTCTLCHIFSSNRCAECPLCIERDGLSCDCDPEHESDRDCTDFNPYLSFVFNGNPEPMIELIIKALVKAVRERRASREAYNAVYPTGA